MAIGRNQPCPCGSGKKYKVCHLVEDAAAALPRTDRLFAVKLGPVETGEGSASIYIGFMDEGALPPVTATDDSVGLAKLAAQVQAGALECERALGLAGRPAGFKPADTPEALLVPRATLAFMLAIGPLGASIRNYPAIEELLRASSQFFRKKPWRHFENLDLVRIALGGEAHGEFEASIMGAGGQEFGIALYEGEGGLERAAVAMEAGYSTTLESLAVTMDPEPEWAAEAIEDAYGLCRVPMPLRVRKGRARPAGGDDILALAVALDAAAQLSPRRLKSTRKIVVEGRTFTATADASGRY